MGCVARVLCIAFIVFIIMFMMSCACSKGNGDVVEVDVVEEQPGRKPIGQLKMHDPPDYVPVARTAEFTPLPRGGLGCANRIWYDEIYNAGSRTDLPAMDHTISDLNMYGEMYHSYDRAHASSRVVV